jgi:hypothetical protein
VYTRVKVTALCFHNNNVFGDGSYKQRPRAKANVVVLLLLAQKKYQEKGTRRNLPVRHQTSGKIRNSFRHLTGVGTQTVEFSVRLFGDSLFRQIPVWVCKHFILKAIFQRRVFDRTSSEFFKSSYSIEEG